MSLTETETGTLKTLKLKCLSDRAKLRSDGHFLRSLKRTLDVVLLHNVIR
jgi:hypothetical protein